MDAIVAGAAVTGLGAICSIGRDIPGMLESLRLGRHGISEIAAFPTEGLSVHHAAEVQDYDPRRYFSSEQVARLDRTAQFAVIAARQAVADAGLGRDALGSGRIGLVMGICAGGIGDGGVTPSPEQWSGREQVERFYRTAHYLQTQAVAEDLGITGPCLTVSTACAASTSALASALTLLESGRADAVVVGGADAYSVTVYAGFYALGAMAERPTSPFSTGIGVTFGEGGGCVVIETAERAERRGARVHGMLLGCGVTSDAHHITAPHPSGEGLRRAMELALSDANLAPASIHYINAHGTGTLDNDVVETLAIRTLYRDEERIPPVSSSKSYFGHTMGGAGILEFIAAMLGMQNGFLPATLNFTGARPGCDLDYVPNTPRISQFDTFLSTSAAFGGINAVAVGARKGTQLRAPRARRDVLVTGLGTVSPIGLGIEEFRASLRLGRTGILPIERFDASGLSCDHAGLVGEFSPRKLAPVLDARRMDLLTRYAAVATALALKDAGLTGAGRPKPERIGLHLALTRGPVSSQAAFHSALAHDGIARVGAKYFPSIVLSTVSGQIAQSFQLKGASFTFVDGAGAGLQALAHGNDYLMLHPELDALVVVAADEVGAMLYRVFDYLGLLAPGAQAPQLYAADGRGLVLGEGAAAMVLVRAGSAAARAAPAYGRISGVALGGEGRAEQQLDAEGQRLEALARQAMQQAGGAADVVYGMARGVARHDLREASALKRLLSARSAPLVCLNGQLGVAEASCGLFAASAALLSLRYGEAYPSRHAELAPEHLPLLRGAALAGDYRSALVLGSSECGNGAALMFAAAEERA